MKCMSLLHTAVTWTLLLRASSTLLAYFWQAYSSEPESSEELRLLPSSVERAETILFAVHELYAVDTSLVARVLPNLQADLLILGLGWISVTVVKSWLGTCV